MLSFTNLAAIIPHCIPSVSSIQNAFSPYITFPQAKKPSKDVAKSTTSNPDVLEFISKLVFLITVVSGKKLTDNRSESHSFSIISSFSKLTIFSFSIRVFPSISVTLEFSITGISKPSIISRIPN